MEKKKNPENTMKFESTNTKSLHDPDTKGILHQKSTYFEVSFFKNSEVWAPTKSRFPANQIRGTNSLSLSFANENQSFS